MTTYFITGATGFIGRRLVGRLLARTETTTVYALTRPSSAHKVSDLAAELNAGRTLVPVEGDLTREGLDVDPESLGAVDHVVHLAAMYDFTASEQENRIANVAGTSHVIELVSRLGSPRLHHVSSIAVAGDHNGRYTESDFDLGQSLPSAYHASKFEAEKLVRGQRVAPYTVYRPSAVVGDSVTGEMDKIDGPYYFLPAIARMATMPSAIPLPSVELGATNLVPVDYVVAAMDYLIHREVRSGATYHLAASSPQPLNEVYNAFARAAGAPRVAEVAPGGLSRMLTTPASAVASGAAAMIERTRTGKETLATVLDEVGIPRAVLPHLATPVRFDTSATREALAGSGIALPALEEYADALYRYWEQHLDPEWARRSNPHGIVHGRTVLITGASSGIGRAAALRVAANGATVALVARRADELEAVRAEIADAGGAAHAYACDLTEDESVDALVKNVLDDLGSVDMLVNNAGRSIRRSVHLSTQRVHDFERTMAINYFGHVRLTLGLLPSMRQRRFGHIVNITSQGIETDTPRFSAYLSSKAALEEFGLTTGRETLHEGVTFTSLRMPLVRTEMISPTGVYRTLPAISAEQAAKLVLKALVRRPVILSLPAGNAAELASRLQPGIARAVANVIYTIMPESAPEAAKRRPRHPLAAAAGTVTRLAWRRKP